MAINNCLVKRYDSKKARQIYQALKPLLKEKNNKGTYKANTQVDKLSHQAIIHCFSAKKQANY